MECGLSLCYTEYQGLKDGTHVLTVTLSIGNSGRLRFSIKFQIITQQAFIIRH